MSNLTSVEQRMVKERLDHFKWAGAYLFDIFDKPKKSGARDCIDSWKWSNNLFVKNGVTRLAKGISRSRSDACDRSPLG